MFLLYDKLPIQDGELAKCANNPPGYKKLGCAVFSRVVVDGDFGKYIPCICDLFNQFEADGSAYTFQFDLV